MNQDDLKKAAALKAVEFVTSGTILGLGTGSTVSYAVERIGLLIKEGKLTNIVGVPTSKETEVLALKSGVPLTSLRDNPRIDITIDGADEVDINLNLIKGGGGALFREKIVAEASQRIIIVIDESKFTNQIGSKWPVPVEIATFALKPVTEYITELGAKTDMRMTSDGLIYVTDEGNNIIDCNFGPLTDPETIASKLSRKSGVIEHGLFLDLATDVIIAGKEKIEQKTKDQS